MVKEDFGAIYSVVALSMLFFISFLILFFYIRGRFLLNKNRSLKIIVEIICGGIFGFLSMFFFYYIKQFWFELQFSLIIFLLFVIICFPFTFYCSIFTSISFSIVTIGIWSWELVDFTGPLMYAILFCIFYLSFFSYLGLFFKKKNIKLVFPLIAFLLLLIITISINYFRNQEIFYFVIFNGLFFSYVYIYLANYLNNFFEKTILIKE